jgi:hypothetical protein
VTKGVGPSDTRTFPSFDDLAAWAVQYGLAQSVADVRTTERSLWGDLLFRWYTQGQVACVFAQVLARDPAAAGWYSAVMEGAWTADHVTGAVDAAAKEQAEALQLLFPGNATVEEALALIRTLAGHSRWKCGENAWLEGEAGDSVQVGLRWISPAGDYESWVLGIAPFEPMPFTRRMVGAPFIALVLRPTKPMAARANVPTGITGLPASHLAHMDDGLGKDQALRDKWMNGTSKAKRALVSPDPMSRARAKVTFAFPAWARTELKGVL